MFDWFALSVFACALFGVQAFMYKTGMKKDMDEFILVGYFTLSAAVISLLVFLSRPPQFPAFTAIFLLAILYGLFFSFKTLAQMKALKFLPTNIVFPVTASNVLLVVIASFLFLNESLSMLQIIGIALVSFAVIFLYFEKSFELQKKHFIKGFAIALLAMFFSAALSFTNKIAAMNADKLLFMSVAYFFGASVSFALRTLARDSNSLSDLFLRKDIIALGLGIGVINFFGWYSLLSALSYGPLSLIAPVISLYVFVAAVLGVIFHKEKLTVRRFLLMAISIFGVILLKI